MPCSFFMLNKQMRYIMKEHIRDKFEDDFRCIRGYLKCMNTKLLSICNTLVSEQYTVNLLEEKMNMYCIDNATMRDKIIELSSKIERLENK